MRRRAFVGLLGASAALPFAAVAQQAGRTYRLGCLLPPYAASFPEARRIGTQRWTHEAPLFLLIYFHHHGSLMGKRDLHVVRSTPPRSETRAIPVGGERPET